MKRRPLGSRRRLRPQASRYIPGSSPQAPKATFGSVPCACVLVSSLYYKPSVKRTGVNNKCGRSSSPQPRHERRCPVKRTGVNNRCEQINRSHTQTHTYTPTENNTPRHRNTRTRQEQHPKPPNEHLPQTLNSARRWRDNGACHLPRPGGWPRRSQRDRYRRSPT